MGILTVYVLGNTLKNSMLLRWAGQNSLSLYVLHFKFTGVIHYFVKHIAGIKLDLYSSPYYYVVFLLEFLFLYNIIKMFYHVRQCGHSSG